MTSLFGARVGLAIGAGSCVAAAAIGTLGLRRVQRRRAILGAAAR
jgi:hypothetical protein